jgi:hypothetical protein
MDATALSGPASAHGYPSGQWKDVRVGLLIARELRISFSRVYVRQLIIDLGFADCLIHKSSRPPVNPGTQVSTATLTSWVAAALRHSPKAQGSKLIAGPTSGFVRQSKAALAFDILAAMYGRSTDRKCRI